MQPGSLPRSRRASRGLDETPAKRFYHEGSSPSAMGFTGPYYPQQPYYVPSMPTQPYMPYAQYQQQQPQFNYNGYPQAVPYQQMPPSKRPRTEIRHVSASASSRTPTKKVTPTKVPSRKTFSDFRISRVTIGSWQTAELREETDIRDSRIRFCFRNATDRDPAPTLSATEAALVTPDRISISVKKGTQRIVVPAHHIKRVEFSRKTGDLAIETDGWAAFETFSETAGDATWLLTETDLTEGQLSSARRIDIRLDQDKPLTEPKWTRGNLQDHIDSNSRFLKVLHIIDADPPASFDTVLEAWSGDDADKAYFCTHQLTSQRLLLLLTNLMSSSNILTRAITNLLEELVNTMQGSDALPHLTGVIRSALFLVPENMLVKSLDHVYYSLSLTSDHESELSNSASRLMIETSGAGGSKRQRGESEVPSDQLAKASLDEKRRRLSASEEQAQREAARAKLHYHHHGLGSHMNDTAEDLEDRLAMQEDGDADSDDEDRCRLSREELLRELEFQENEENEEDEVIVQ